MKKITIIITILLNVGISNAQKPTSNIDCEEISFWQSKFTSIIKKIKTNSKDINAEYNSNRILKSFDISYLIERNDTAKTENYFDEYAAAKGKENVNEIATGINAEKEIRSEIEAQKYYNSILETFKQCLKTQQYEIETSTDEAYFYKISEKNNTLLSSNIDLGIVPIKATNSMGEYTVGYKVVLEWSYSELRFY